jgi:hypothetical protein
LGLALNKILLRKIEEKFHNNPLSSIVDIDCSSKPSRSLLPFFLTFVIHSKTMKTFAIVSAFVAAAAAQQLGAADLDVGKTREQIGRKSTF